MRQKQNKQASVALRAAQYVRMSTEHQRYSTQNQADAIAAYAAAHGLTIVRQYADEGRSGLRLDGRPALKELISDVVLGRADFSIILVFDVSRWGRFQDTDESAHYEFICKEAGVNIEYCAEDFRNDGSFISNVAKHLKRAMAGEYSKDLSRKVFAGQCRLIRLGFKQGGSAVYGLQRELLDQNGASRGLLAPGERKHLQTDRVVLRPGPPAQIRVVRRIFREFVFRDMTEIDIARGLNKDGITSQSGGLWKRWLIHELLVNESYIGNNVFNRRSFKLGKKMVRNPPSAWVRKENAFPAIVKPAIFYRAARIIEHRRAGFSDDDLLKHLKTYLTENGRLSKRLIDKSDHMPCAQLYQERFGGLNAAYALIGYQPAGDFSYIDANRRLSGIRTNVIRDAIREIGNVGGVVQFDEETGVLTINAEFSAVVMVTRCTPTRDDYPIWRVRIGASPRRDVTIVARTDERALKIADYFLIPNSQMSDGIVALYEHNGSELDAYRFPSLNALFRLDRDIFAELQNNPQHAFEERKRDKHFSKRRMAHGKRRSPKRKETNGLNIKSEC